MTVVEIAIPKASALPARRTWVRRFPTAIHVAGLTLVLLALWVAGPRGHGFTDDGAALSAQLDILADGSWTVAHPYPEVDPNFEHFPDRNAAQRAGTEAYAPYVKHPLVPLLLSPVHALAGDAAVELVILAGLLAAAVAVARVVRLVAPAAATPALWLTGVGSVLLVHGLVLWVHAWAMAASAVGIEAALRVGAPDRRSISWRPALVLVAVAALVVLLRTEGVLWAGAVAVGLGTAGRRPGQRHLLILAAAVVLSAVVAVAAERWWAELVLGGPSVPQAAAATDGYVVDRLLGSFMVLLLGAPSWGSGALARLGAVAMLAALAPLVVAGRPVPGLRLLIAAATAVYVVAVLIPPWMIPGFIPALPLLVVPLAVPGRRPAWPEAPLFTMVVTYVALLAATVHRGGGGGDWGGRYAALAVPMLAVLAAHRLTGQEAPGWIAGHGRFTASRGSAGPHPLRWLAVCLVLATIATAPPLYVELRSDAATAAHARERVLEQAGLVQPAEATGRPVALVLDGLLARHLAVDRHELATLRIADPADLAPMLDRLRVDGVRQVLLVGSAPLVGPLHDGRLGMWEAAPAQVVSTRLESSVLTAG